MMLKSLSITSAIGYISRLRVVAECAIKQLPVCEYNATSPQTQSQKIETSNLKWTETLVFDI